MHATPLRCAACDTPVDAGPHCRNCTDRDGRVLSFDARLAALRTFLVRTAGLGPEEAERRSLALLVEMPAWRDEARARRG